MFSQDDSSLRPVVMATTGIKFAPPLTEYTVPLPPSSPPPTIPAVTRPPPLLRPPSLQGVTISTNHIGGAPSVGGTNEREGGAEETTPPVREGERRRRRGRGRRKRRREGELNSDLPETPLHNHVPHPPPEAATVAGATPGVGVANLPPSATRVVSDGMRGAESRLGGRERGSRVSVSELKLVRIKEEPLDEETGNIILLYMYSTYCIPTYVYT